MFVSVVFSGVISEIDAESQQEADMFSLFYHFNHHHFNDVKLNSFYVVMQIFVTGDQVAIYNELGYPRAVRDVTFHPHEHMVAFCCFSPNMPVLVFNYDKNGKYLTAIQLQIWGTQVRFVKRNQPKT